MFKAVMEHRPISRRIIMQETNYSLEQTQVGQQEVSRVLRNTYSLLALTLAFSGLVAFISQQMNLPHPGMIITLVAFYGLFFLTAKLRDSGWGLLSTFALTGFMGYTLGPILNHYLGMANGGEVVSTALGMTALVFFGLSAYVLTTRKDMSFLSGFIIAGFFVLLGAMVAGIFFNIPGLHLAISAGFVLFASASILFQTSAIIHGGERNYIMATISLYISIYNLFVSLLQIIGVVSGDD
jgi:modulator of FtsH protease